MSIDREQYAALGAYEAQANANLACRIAALENAKQWLMKERDKYQQLYQDTLDACLLLREQAKNDAEYTLQLIEGKRTLEADYQAAKDEIAAVRADLEDRKLQVASQKETIKSFREHYARAERDCGLALDAAEALRVRVRELEDALELMADQFKRVAGERDSLAEVARTTADSGIWWMDKTLEHRKTIEQLTQELQAERQAKAILVERLKVSGPRLGRVVGFYDGNNWYTASDSADE